jgi:hypothetical protein
VDRACSGRRSVEGRKRGHPLRRLAHDVGKSGEREARRSLAIEQFREENRMRLLPNQKSGDLGASKPSGPAIFGQRALA